MTEAITFRTLAMERVDLVDAFAIVETRLGGAVICIDLAKHALIPYIHDTYSFQKLQDIIK